MNTTQNMTYTIYIANINEMKGMWWLSATAAIDENWMRLFWKGDYIINVLLSWEWVFTFISTHDSLQSGNRYYIHRYPHTHNCYKENRNWELNSSVEEYILKCGVPNFFWLKNFQIFYFPFIWERQKKNAKNKTDPNKKGIKFLSIGGGLLFCWFEFSLAVGGWR